MGARLEDCEVPAHLRMRSEAPQVSEGTCKQQLCSAGELITVHAQLIAKIGWDVALRPGCKPQLPCPEQ